MFDILWLKFASEFSGRVRLRVRIRSRIAATAVHSAAMIVSRDRCSNTPVALCFLWSRRLSLLRPTPLKMAYRNPKTGLGRGASQKNLASDAYRAVGGVA